MSGHRSQFWTNVCFEHEQCGATCKYPLTISAIKIFQGIAACYFWHFFVQVVGIKWCSESIKTLSLFSSRLFCSRGFWAPPSQNKSTKWDKIYLWAVPNQRITTNNDITKITNAWASHSGLYCLYEFLGVILNVSYFRDYFQVNSRGWCRCHNDWLHT
jgi:hypothetical protein